MFAEPPAASTIASMWWTIRLLPGTASVKVK
jgi:hypothetical protein